MDNSITSIRKGAMLSGAINAAINGIINWFLLDHDKPIWLTPPSQDGHHQTLFGEAIVLAISLALILTCIAYFTTKSPNKPPFYPTFFWKAIHHCIYSFGWVALLGWILQKTINPMELTPLVAAGLIGVIAGVVSYTVEFSTKSEILNSK